MICDKILVNLQRCTGCWSCSLGCKMVNELDDDDFRIMVYTVGNGHGTDRPAGQWPNLDMSWMPVWSEKCTSCAEKNTDHGMFCVYTCPSHALTCGEAADKEEARLKEEGFEICEADEEHARGNVFYARPEPLPVPSQWERFPIIEAEYVEDVGDEAPTVDGSLIGDLAENPDTAAILEEFLPWLDVGSPEGAAAKGMTLRALAPFSQGLLDDGTLDAISERFAALVPSPKFTVEGSLIGDIADNADGAAILANRIPWLDVSSEMGAAAKGMTLRALAPFSQGLLDDETLDALARDFESLADGAHFADGK